MQSCGIGGLYYNSTIWTVREREKERESVCVCVKCKTSYSKAVSVGPAWLQRKAKQEKE